MRATRKNQITFRPSVDGALLEDRVVLSGSGSSMLGTALVSSAQTGQQSGLTALQLRRAFAQQFRTAQNDLRQQIGNQITLAFRNGRPTTQQLADLSARIHGAINATAVRLSSQAAQLPNSNARLVPAIQNALLGSNGIALLNRIQALTQSQRATGSLQALQAAVGRQLNTAFVPVTNQLAAFFNTAAMNQQTINQLGDTLAALSQGFGTVAGQTLSANGATTAGSTAIAAFQDQANQAVATAAFQLGTNLPTFPIASTVSSALVAALLAQVQAANSSGFLGFGTTLTGVNTTFATTFTDTLSTLNPIFGFNAALASAGIGFTTPAGNAGMGFTTPAGSAGIGFTTPAATMDTGFM